MTPHKSRRKPVIYPDAGKSVVLPGGIPTIFKVISRDTGGAFAIVEHVLEPGVLGAHSQTQ